jgi:membrane fusion protein (multidrug efflux system)
MAGTIGFEPQEGRQPGLPEREQQSSYSRRRLPARWILLALVCAVAVTAYFLRNYYSTRESTDDAQIDAHINAISAKVGGTVTTVNVDDNQTAQAGTVLVEIDSRDYRVALDRARADLEVQRASARAAETVVPITSTTTASQLSRAEADVQAAGAALAAAQKEVEAARAQLRSIQARFEEAKARSTLAQQDLARMKQLVAQDEISRQQYDSAVAAADAARAGVDSAQAAVAQAEQGVPVAESHVAQARAVLARVEADVAAAGTGPQRVAVSQAESGSAQARIHQAEASLAQAELNLQYTRITAPVSGVVSKKTVEVGQVIQPGQPLMAIVPLENIWVTANFKETQLHQMRPGQPAIISVDAYGGSKFRARVDSIAAATGAKFSVLPPENATGNFVKVVQRVPVKIVLEEGQDPQHLLRPGMSVVATVITK